MIGTSMLVGMATRRAANMGKNHIVQREVDKNIDARYAGIAQDLAVENPAAAAEHVVDRLTAEADLETARQSGKTKRTFAVATVAALAIGAGAGGLLIARKDTRDLIEGIGGILKPAIPHSVRQEQVLTALQKVEVTGDQGLSAGIVKSNAELETRLVSCTFLGCVTLTGQKNNTTRLVRLDDVAKEGALDLDVGHTKKDGSLSSFYFKANVDPTLLELRTGDPTEQDLADIGLPLNTRTVNNGGKDGRIAGLFEGITNAIGVSDENSYASRSELTFDKATKAAKANCGPVLDQVRAAGITNITRNYVETAIDLNEGLGTEEGKLTADTLREVLKQPIRIQYRTVDQAKQDAGREAYRYVSPTDVHVFNGQSPEAKQTFTNDLTGPNKVEGSVTTAVDNECLIAPQAMTDLLAIAEQKDYIVLEKPGSNDSNPVNQAGDL